MVTSDVHLEMLELREERALKKLARLVSELSMGWDNTVKKTMKALDLALEYAKAYHEVEKYKEGL